MSDLIKISEEELLKLKCYGFSDSDIQRKLNGEKLISEEVGKWLLEKELLKSSGTEISKIYLYFFNFDEYYLDKNWKQKIMLDYIFISKDFQVLEENNNCLLKMLLELYRIPFVNEAIYKYTGSTINLFYANNFVNINMLFSKYVNSIVKSDLSLDEKIPMLSKDEVIDIVIQYFDEIDLSGNIKKQFLSGIDSGNILLWDLELDKDNRKEYAKEKFLNCEALEINKMFSYENQFFINILLKGNLEDTLTIIHEFFHKYSFNGENYLCNKNNMFLYELSPFDELASIYFESHFCIFLKKIGFSEEAVLASHRYRKLDNIYNYAHNVEFSQLIKKTMFDKQKITLDDFVLDYDSLIKFFKENYQDMNENQKKLLSIWENLNKSKIENAKKRCDDFIESIMFKFNSYYCSYGYIFDSIITDYLLQKSDKSVKWMLNFVKDMFLLYMDPYDILSMMLPSSMMFLFEYTYNVSYDDKVFLKKKDCGIKRLTLLDKD